MNPDAINTLYIAAIIAGYLAGSVPFGLVLTKLAGLGDVRDIGSGNIGATNVLRTGNKMIAAATLLLDGGKGAAVALIFAQWGENAGLLAALCAVIGHNFPVWLKFKGGKGVATTLGVLLATMWPVGIAACLIWVAGSLVFRISSLAALLALAASPVVAHFLETPNHVMLAGALAVLGFIRHHANIRRIVAGDEPKIGKKS